MISKLKQICGYDYTAKLARMFNDMSNSRDLLEAFKAQEKDIGKSMPSLRNFNTFAS